MVCVNGCKECTGCMRCQKAEAPCLRDEFGKPIYAGEVYYKIEDLILSKASLGRYRKIETEDSEYYEDAFGEPIYVGDTYYDLPDRILTVESMDVYEQYAA